MTWSCFRCGYWNYIPGTETYDNITKTTRCVRSCTNCQNVGVYIYDSNVVLINQFPYRT